MGMLIDAGVTVVRALDLISEQTRSERLFKILELIKRDIRAGMTLKDAFAQHPKSFPRVWISLIEAGETSGHLSAVLNQMAIHLEASINLHKKIISAMIYPSVLILASIGAVLIFMLKIIPIFANLFKSFNAELPLLTRVLMAMSNFLRQYTFYFFVAMGVTIYVRPASEVFSPRVDFADRGRRNERSSIRGLKPDGHSPRGQHQPS